MHKEKLVNANCNIPIWIQYKKHKAVFELIRKKIKTYANYYQPYNQIMKQIQKAASGNNSNELKKLYRELWEIICEFFSSKEYLGSYNPIFLNAKNKRAKDEILSKIFEIEEMDTEKEFYEILLHLVYKVITKEKYENLKKLGHIIVIAKKWREFIKNKKNYNNFC